MKSNSGKLPKARQDELFIEQLDEGLLVYDARNFCAHRLNATAAWVWRHCDGKQAIADTTRLLSAELQQPLDEELVWLSLDTLDKAQLLSSPVQHPVSASDDSRRAMIQKMVMAGGLMFLLPVITPLTKPAKAQGDATPAATEETSTPLFVNLASLQKSLPHEAAAITASMGHGTAIRGISPNGTGVSGQSDTHSGVYGVSNTGVGVRGTSPYGTGVTGSGPIGVDAYSDTGTALHAKAGTGKGRAGFFEGDVEVTGDIRLINADCAEDFDIVDAETIEAGTVMVLCEEGALQLSQKAYDKRVAGVISGAGDYKPGLILDKKPTGRPRKPVALMGKVFCKADARYGAIEAGDLLTTSDTPGHAMKAGDPVQAFGAVVGKALRGLPEGQGLIPILVSLQ